MKHGKAPPDMFPRVAPLIAGLALACSASLLAQSAPDRQGGARRANLPDEISTFRPARSFRMGFTPQPYALDSDAYVRTYQIVNRNSDVIAHHIVEGVPWPEAHARTRYHANVEKDLQTRLTRSDDSRAVYLAISPLSEDRKSLAGYWSSASHQARPGKWRDKRIDDREIADAYLNFARDMIKRFRPRYLAYGVEANSLLRYEPGAARQYLKFLEVVYPTLKREFPSLPVFLTFAVGPPAEAAGNRWFIEPFLPYTDAMALSIYPYVWSGIGSDVRKLPADWLSYFPDLAPNKPLIIAETGFIAEDFSASGKIIIPSNSSLQFEYMELLLSEANRLRAALVVWFVPIDYDALWEVMRKANANEWLKIWRDCGLYDGKLQPRPALRIWNRWLARPLSAEALSRWAKALRREKRLTPASEN